MTRQERYHVSRQEVPPWTVIYRNTLRLVWRDGGFRVEALLLLLLTLLAAVASQGSANPGDAALRMTAAAYDPTPFFCVYVIGQLTLHGEEEASWWQRRVTRGDYYLGRFLGLFVLGLCLMIGEAGVGGVLWALIAHLPLGPSLIWNVGLMLGIAAPGLVLVLGLYLWLAEMSGGGFRYFLPAIMLALSMSLAEYQLPRLLGVFPHLVFYNPFPTFLSLGLSLPSTLLGRFPLPGWLMLNRSMVILVGLVFLAVAMVHHHGYGRRYLPAKHRPGRWAAALSICVILTLFATSPFIADLAPRSTSQWVITQASPLLTRPDHLRLRLNAGSGAIVGTESIPVPHYAVPPSGLRLNRGLAIRSITLAGRKIAWKAVAHGDVVAGSAARLIALQVPRVHGGQLTVRFYGHLLPYASPLPYAPFNRPAFAYETMALGQHRLFLDGVGSWFPEPLLKTAHSFEALPVKGRLRLTVSHLAPKDPVITTLERRAKAPLTWTGSLAHPLFAAAPYRTRRLGTLALYLGHTPLTSKERTALTRYSTAWSSVRPVLGQPFRLRVVQSPVSLNPSLDHRILLISGLHPFVTPKDPVSNLSVEPSLADAQLRLSLLFWQGKLGDLGAYPWQSRGLGAQRVAPMLAVLTVLRSDGGQTRKAIYQDIQHRRPLPGGIGRLSAYQVRWLKALSPLTRTRPVSAWAHAYSHLAQPWPHLDNPSELALWLTQEVNS